MKGERNFIISLFIALIVIFFSCSKFNVKVPYTAQGAKVGEVTSNSAIVWVRLTKFPERNTDPGDWHDTGKPTQYGGVSDPGFVGECPGIPGKVRIHYDKEKDLSHKKSTPWISVDESNDFIYQSHLKDLNSSTIYYYQVETSDTTGRQSAFRAAGSFGTAPDPDDWQDILFTVLTGHRARTRDREDGYNTYISMKNLQPDFFVHTGDNIYYDSDPPIAKTPQMARFHWHRMHSFPTIVSFFQTVPVYFEKDDHDYRWNDSDPHRDFPGLSHEEGVAIFKQQVPMGEKTYRTYRWGKGLQIWLVEGRDYRSNNKMPDGPEKTIWGKEQKAWLKEGIKSSDAIFKVLISPTPIVGPDSKGKRDNHANPGAFYIEGREFLKWAKQNAGENFFIVNGDRHWQYHSIDETGVMEFSCGCATDIHARSDAPRWSKKRQPYLGLKTGGFLSVKVSGTKDNPGITFEHRDEYGRNLYRWQKTIK